MSPRKKVISPSSGDAPRNRILSAFSSVAEPMVIQAAWLLSTVLAINRRDFVDLFVELWPEGAGHEEAVEEILSWPFAELTGDGYRMSGSAANAFRLDFLNSDELRFRRAHELLATLEASREVVEDPDETWFIRGRYAYYLAGYDQSRSIQVFGDGFAEPPMLDRTDARMWLSWLAIQQEDLLDEVPRAIAFFRGFRAYVSGARKQAREAFDTVLEGDEVDIYQALAAHFAGLLRRRSESETGIRLLRESISLSSGLNLPENEIMARNSLVIALIASRDDDVLGEASALGSLNLSRALATQDPHLISWCRTTYVTSVWSNLTKRHSTVGAQALEIAPSLVAELEAVIAEVAHSDPETRLQAANEAASILRDVGAYEQALELLDRTISDAAMAQKHQLERLAKTTGSMLRGLNPEQRAVARELLARIETLKE
jgi:hypothetical protein